MQRKHHFATLSEIDDDPLGYLIIQRVNLGTALRDKFY